MSDLTLDHTTIEPTGPAGAFVLTDEEVATLGGGKRAAVRVRVGEREVRVRLASMAGQNLIGLSRANRSALGVEIGDVVDAVVSLDVDPREVEVPAVLARALAADPEVQARFDALAPTHRRDFARWIHEAKKDETRERRVTQTLQMLRDGRTR